MIAITLSATLLVFALALAMYAYSYIFHQGNDDDWPHGGVVTP